jgi:hypothetical protein
MASLRFKGLKLATLNVMVGNVTAIVLFLEFCDTDIFNANENGVPSQFFEYDIEELVCVARMSPICVAE